MNWFRNIAIRSNWYNQQPLTWSSYTGLDIQEFHFEFRSILDYVSAILVKLSDKSGQVKGENSFRELYQWLESETTAENKLGTQISAIIRAGYWYDDIRQIRDNIIHYGADAFVFGTPKDGILFQVSKKNINQINIKELMWNDNIVDFELYAGLYFARMLVLLDKLGKLIISKIPKQYISSSVKANYDGLSVYARWINRLVEKINSAA
jgi:hypothetical protein